MFATKLVLLDYKDLKTVLSKLSLMTLRVCLLQQLNFHQAPNLAATALGQRLCWVGLRKSSAFFCKSTFCSKVTFSLHLSFAALKQFKFLPNSFVLPDLNCNPPNGNICFSLSL